MIPTHDYVKFWEDSCDTILMSCRIWHDNVPEKTIASAMFVLERNCFWQLNLAMLRASSESYRPAACYDAKTSALDSRLTLAMIDVKPDFTNDKQNQSHILYRSINSHSQLFILHPLQESLGVANFCWTSFTTPSVETTMMSMSANLTHTCFVVLTCVHLLKDCGARNRQTNKNRTVIEEEVHI